MLVSAYLPQRARVEKVSRLTNREKLFTVTVPAGFELRYSPGQFFMAGLPGYGEGPFSITSAMRSSEDAAFEFCIREVGNLSAAIHRLVSGDSLWIRGPFGRGFDVSSFSGKDALFIAGGIGMVPMRSLIKAIAAGSRGNRYTIIYGAKTPEELLFRDEIEGWRDKGFDVKLTIDKPLPDWSGNVGVVTALLPGVKLNPEKTLAVIIGPPIMYRFVIVGLKEKGLGADSILLSLERRMKCGLGKCGHCQIHASYVCQEGPVYKLSELKDMPEAL